MRVVAEHLWADVARVRLQPIENDRLQHGANYAFGSGRLIGHNLVLTARHVLETADGVPLPDIGWEVRLLGDRVDGMWKGDPISAEVAWRARKLDLALLKLSEVDRYPISDFKLQLARYESVADRDGFWIAGFPHAAREERTIAREYSAMAKLRRADQARQYRLTVSAADAPRLSDDWSGCSGGVILFRKREVIWLLGVVQQVPKAFGDGALQAAPIHAARDDPDFRKLIKELCTFDPDDIYSLEKLPGLYEPVGAEAFAASNRSFGLTINRPFYGRNFARTR